MPPQEVELPEVADPNNATVPPMLSKAGETPTESVKDQDIKRMGIITALAMGLHNLPEGLATFIATLADPSFGMTMCIAIAVHNIPEGLSVAAPLYSSTGSRCQGLMWSVISALAEPLGAGIGWAFFELFLKGQDTLIGCMFGFIAGVMIYISFMELLPSAYKKASPRLVHVSLFLGFLIMDLSIVLSEEAGVLGF